MKTTARIALALILVSFTAVSWAQDDLKDHPGYVDLKAAEIFGEVDAKLELMLKGPLLKLIGGEDKEGSGAGGLLASIELIRVNAFEIEENAEEIIAKFKALGDALEEDGWARVLSANEDGETINVFIRSNDDTIQGLALFATESDEAIFANIVGDVKPELLSHLGDDFLGGDFDLSEIAEAVTEHEDGEKEVKEEETEEG